MCTNCSLTTKSTLVWKFELLASRFDAILCMGSAGSSLPFYWEDRINTDILDVLCRIRFCFIRTSIKNRLLSKQMHCHRHWRAGFRLPIFYGKRHFLNIDCLNDLNRTCSKFMDFMRDLNIWSAYVPNGLDAFHSMVSGDFPQVLACIFARIN